MTDEETLTPDPEPVREAAPAADAAGPAVNTVRPVEPSADQALTLVRGDVVAQKMGEPRPGPSTKPVQETFYKTDRVITDTADPLAVQPGPQDVVEHNSGKTAEQQFGN